MSLFDPQPKKEPYDLYGREKELTALVDDLKNKRWVVLLGPRRVGKTSLAQCAANELDMKTVFIDARSNPDLLNGLMKELSSRPSPSVRVGVGVAPFSGSVAFSRPAQLQSLDDTLKKSREHLLVIVDEAERLRNPRGVSSLLAHLYDYFYDDVTFLITGSAVGVMNSIITPTSKSPLFGRAIVHTELKKWADYTTSLNFLIKGCTQAHVKFEERDLSRAVERLDGLPGWLTFFGFHYQRDRSYERAMKSTVASAVKIISDELEETAKLANGWERQRRILQLMSLEPMTFTEIKNAMKISSTALSGNLDMLTRLQYIERDIEGRYGVADPLVREYLRRGI